MGGFIWILIAIAALLIWQNWDLVSRLLPKKKPTQKPAQLIETSEFKILKPAGFYQPPEASLFSLYTEVKTGAISVIDGESIREEFNCAWAVVSISPGDTLEICRNMAKQDAIEILQEDDTTAADTADKRLSITVVKKTRLSLRIETTHTVVVSAARQKTYELRTSVMASKKEAYRDAIAQIIQSFEIL